MATQAEITVDLKAVLAQQQKTAGEISTLQAGVTVLNTQITDLQAQLAAGAIVSQDLIDAVAAVKAQAQRIDELIPDVPNPNPAVARK